MNLSITLLNNDYYYNVNMDYLDFRLKNVSVKYIGLNPQDTIVDMRYNNVEYDELGPIDYSGVASDGSLMMGIAPFIPTVSDITADPILSWAVPKNMSLEEASTIPVPYSMVKITFVRSEVVIIIILFTIIDIIIIIIIIVIIRLYILFRYIIGILHVDRN